MLPKHFKSTHKNYNTYVKMSIIIFWVDAKKKRNKNVAESTTHAVYRFANEQSNYSQVYLNIAFRCISKTVLLFLNNISQKKVL